jgi:hypothetical protein
MIYTGAYDASTKSAGENMKKYLFVFTALLAFFCSAGVYGEMTETAASQKQEPPAKPSKWNEPTEFRGLPWGAPVAEMKKKFNGAHCKEHEENINGDAICKAEFTVGEIPVTGYFYFRKGFTRVVLQYNPKDFGRMMAIFQEKYGLQTKKEEKEVSTRNGLKYINVRYAWLGSKVEIKAVKYNKNVSESGAGIWLLSDKAVAYEKYDQSAKQAADDL